MKKTTYIKEVKIMKKMIMTLFLVALSVVFVYGYADATVSGTCSACHTMHNSQNNTSTGVDFEDDDTPNAKLLRGGCVGCHAQDASGTSNIVDSVTPQVHHADAGGDLAGGNFAGVVTAQGNGHNLPALSGVVADTANTTPPGYLAGYDPNGTSFTASTFVCAGTLGCHGDRAEANEFTAVAGGHHGDDAVLKYGTLNLSAQGGDVTTSYRMLLGVKGAEDSDWEEAATASSTNHNGYLGQVYASRSAQGTEGDTISEFCATCHGAFHATGASGIGTDAGVWIRHPTDVVIPDTAGSEYAAISTTYDVTTPMGRTAAALGNNLAVDAATNGTLTFGSAGNAIVICLSCHKAHASEYADALRFDYQNTVADLEGCLHCHTGKDAF